MKVLHIIPTLQRGGAERICLDVCTELLKRSGVEVKLVVLHEVLEYDASTVLHPVLIPATVNLSVWKKNALHVETLMKEILAFEPDIIHTHLFEAEVVSRSIDYPKAKWFSHCHDNMWQLNTFAFNTVFSKHTITAFYERLYLLGRYRKNGGNRFIAISNNTRKHFQSILPKDLNHVALLHNAIDTKKFTKPIDYKPKQTACWQLVTTGSLVENKNQAFLLQVVKRMTKKNYSVHLHVLGDGPNRGLLEEKARSLKIEDNVTFYGKVEKVEEVLWNCDVYVHSAKSEAFGLVLVEAMAAGLPVVALDAGGNRDIIQDQKNGYILQEPDVVDFANKVGLLFHDKFKYEQIKQAALETAKQFDIVSYTDKLLELYRRALKEK